MCSLSLLLTLLWLSNWTEYQSREFGKNMLINKHCGTTGNFGFSLFSFVEYLCFRLKTRIYFSVQNNWVHWFGLFHLYCGHSCLAWNMGLNGQQRSVLPLEGTISVCWIWREFSIIRLQLSIRELDDRDKLCPPLFWASICLAVGNLTENSLDFSLR